MKVGDTMYALFLVLNEVDYLDDILSTFLDIGVKGATILDSQGMGGALVHGENRDIPLFRSLKSFLDSSRPYNKTIFTVIQSEELVKKAMQAVNDVVGDISRPGVGLMFTVPIGHIYGMNENCCSE
ncbi:hypothetical protein [uncultured Clostridium sp.]|uniref:hypothetical protein n=1 Tax=uncultured Clostridium sp. TaxID=59620 RepID=UPI0028EBC3E2|nr:hypothetical protein [uncultured Clostridium sp.]